MPETTTAVMWWDHANISPPGSINARSTGKCMCEEAPVGAVAYAHPDCEMHGNEAYQKWAADPANKKHFKTWPKGKKKVGRPRKETVEA